MSRTKRLVLPLSAAMLLAAIVVIFACTGSGGAKEKPHYVFKEGAGPNGAVAMIDGKPVSEEELVGDDKLEYIDLVKKVYDFQIGRLGQVLLDRVYRDDAKKANMPLQAYIEKKVFKGEPKVSDKEYDNFVKEKKIPKEQLSPQLKERILAYMKAQKRQDEVQALIAKLSRQHKVEVYLKKPDMKVDIDVGNAPTFGNKNAKVKVVEFSDFQCPFCSRAAATVTELKKMYGNKVLFAFKQYPLPMHPQAKPAAEASLCVNEQGSDKFWKYHDKLFANSEKLGAEDLKKYAKEIGANVDQFNKCFDEKKYAQAVQADTDYGNKLGVRSTPTFFVNGKLISGAQPVESFKEVIDEELSQ